MINKTVLIIVSLLICYGVQAQYDNSLLIETLMKTDTTSIGQKISYPTFTDSEVTMLKITIKPGQSTGWHKHEFPVFANILKGCLTIEVEGHESKQFTAGTSFSEVINVFHNGMNRGDEDVVLIAFFLGEKGKALTVHK